MFSYTVAKSNEVSKYDMLPNGIGSTLGNVADIGLSAAVARQHLVAANRIFSRASIVANAEQLAKKSVYIGAAAAVGQAVEDGGTAGDFTANGISMAAGIGVAAILTGAVAVSVAFAAPAIVAGLAVFGVGSATVGGVTTVGAGLGFLAGSFGGSAISNIISNVFGEDIKNSVNNLFPLVLDLDGDGVELVSLDQSSVFFDIDSDGYLENTGWASGDDGILVIDLGLDGQVTSADEFVFTNHAPGASGDLEALRLAFDSNNDGVLDQLDERFSEFRIWQDLDQDGETDAGEMKTLAEHGITSLDLTGVPVVQDEGTTGPYDNTILNLSSFTLADGSTGTVGIHAEDGSKVRQMPDRFSWDNAFGPLPLAA